MTKQSTAKEWIETSRFAVKRDVAFIAKCHLCLGDSWLKPTFSSSEKEDYADLISVYVTNNKQDCHVMCQEASENRYKDQLQEKIGIYAWR